MSDIQLDVREIEIARVQLVQKEVITASIAMPGQPGVTSVPPDAHYRVTNIWVNKNTGKLHFEYEVP